MRNYVELHVCRTDGLLPNPEHPEEPISWTTFWRWGTTVDDVEEKRRQYEAILNENPIQNGEPLWIFTGGYIYGDLFPQAFEWPAVKYYVLLDLDNLAFTFDTFIGGAFLNQADWFDQILTEDSPRKTWSHGH